jgi:uncharacterized membrane protein YccC
MPSLNFKKRKLQVVGLIVLSLFVAQILQWDQALWIAVTVTALIGPFSTSLAIEKSRNRIIGTIAGLLIATVLEIFLRYNYQTVFIVGILLAYILGFTVQQNYRYFITVVTVAICLNFEYMNLPFTSFAPISFLIARFMAVLTGIGLFLLTQKYLLGDKNARTELEEATIALAGSIQSCLSQYLTDQSKRVIPPVDLAMGLASQAEAFEELLSASPYAVDLSCIEFRRAVRINRIKQRSISSLLDCAYLQSNTLAEHSLRLKTVKQRLELLYQLVNRYVDMHRDSA